MLQRINADHLLLQQATSTEQWERSVEQLAIGLSRDRVCILSVPTPHAAAYATALAALPKELQACVPSGAASLQSPGAGHVSPGCKSLQCRAGSTGSAILDLTYGCLESTARAVLSTLCRSRLLRLRGDTFSTVLDDLPLPRTQQGSSIMTLKAYVDNFQESMSEGQAPIFSDPQEEMCDRGLLSIILPLEAHDVHKGMLSVMQVKDAAGKWRDVVLGPDEVAVVLGMTMKHATAGILSPATYRVAGDPYGSTTKRATGRRLLHFDLRPRPNAVLDFQQQLEEAGHLVDSKYSGPMAVRSLMQRFELLMSPGKDVHTPQNMEGVAAHAAWEQATSKKGSRKRSSSAVEEMSVDEEGIAPVTRSGNVRRCSSGGLINQHRPSRFKEQAAAAAATTGAGADAEGLHGGSTQGGQQRRPGSAGSGPSSSGGGSQGQQQRPGSGGPGSSGRRIDDALRRRHASEPATSNTLYFVRGHTCTVLDGCLQDDPRECIKLSIRSFTGIERHYYLNKGCPCGRVFEAFCEQWGINLGAVKFLHKGNRVFGADTPAGLQMADGEEFDAVPESSDRLQQARELGPLYRTLFATGDEEDELPI